MAKFQFTSPDGQNYEVEGPDSATEEEAFGILQQQLAGPSAGGVDPATGKLRVNISADPQMDADVAADRPSGLDEFLASANQGVVNAINGPARLLERGANALGIGDALSSAGEVIGLAPNTQAAEEEQKRQMQTAGVTPGGVGEIAGEIIGTLPAAALRGGQFVQGAVQGGALSDERDVFGVGRDAVIGGVGNVVGNRVMRGIGQLAAPVVGGFAQTLAGAGVRLTPGQFARNGQGLGSRILSSAEDKLTSLPVVGDMIQRGRERALGDFNRGAVNRSLGEVGEILPGDIAPGSDSVRYARRRFDDLYTQRLQSMASRLDDQAVADLRAVADEAEGMLPANSERLRTIIDTDVLRNFQGETLPGDGLQRAYSRLGNRIRRLRGRNASPDNEDLADALEGIQQTLLNTASRQSPDGGDAIRGLNRGFATFARVRNAARNGNEEGMFTPRGLRSEVRRSDASANRFAEGDALLQDYANAGSSILPSQIGDSGTAGRIWQSNLLGLGLGTALAAPYAAAAGVTRLATRQGYRSELVGNYARRLASPAGISAPALLVPRNDE